MGTAGGRAERQVVKGLRGQQARGIGRGGSLLRVWNGAAGKAGDAQEGEGGSEEGAGNKGCWKEVKTARGRRAIYAWHA